MKIQFLTSFYVQIVAFIRESWNRITSLFHRTIGSTVRSAPPSLQGRVTTFAPMTNPSSLLSRESLPEGTLPSSTDEFLRHVRTRYPIIDLEHPDGMKLLTFLCAKEWVLSPQMFSSLPEILQPKSQFWVQIRTRMASLRRQYAMLPDAEKEEIQTCHEIPSYKPDGSPTDQLQWLIYHFGQTFLWEKRDTWTRHLQSV